MRKEKEFVYLKNNDERETFAKDFGVKGYKNEK